MTHDRGPDGDDRVRIVAAHAAIAAVVAAGSTCEIGRRAPGRCGVAGGADEARRACRRSIALAAVVTDRVRRPPGRGSPRTRRRRGRSHPGRRPRARGTTAHAPRRRTVGVRPAQASAFGLVLDGAVLRVEAGRTRPRHRGRPSHDDHERADPDRPDQRQHQAIGTRGMTGHVGRRRRALVPASSSGSSPGVCESPTSGDPAVSVGSLGTRWSEVSTLAAFDRMRHQRRRAIRSECAGRQAEIPSNVCMRVIEMSAGRVVRPRRASRPAGSARCARDRQRVLSACRWGAAASPPTRVPIPRGQQREVVPICPRARWSVPPMPRPLTAVDGADRGVLPGSPVPAMRGALGGDRVVGRRDRQQPARRQARQACASTIASTFRR